MKKKTLAISPETFKDNRLRPLNDARSKIQLQLFITRLTSGGTKTYELLYGWCVLSSRPDVLDQATIGTFEKVYSASDLNCEIVRVSIYNTPNCILTVVNNLLDGKSFKDATVKAGIKTGNIKFDFQYGAAVTATFVLRPIIFNETSPTSSRNMFEKHSLYSPYGNTPTFTLTVSNLDKLQILRNANGALMQQHKEVLMAILKYLSTETCMAFSSTECSRFGNIEFINTQCANVFERALVYFENISSEELVDGYKEKTSKKVEVTILPNEITSSKSLLINCFSRNGGQVILDEVKEIKHTPGETVVVAFDTQEPVSDLVVSVWTKENDKWQIWYKHSAVLLRNMVTRIGMVGSTGRVSSPFLDRVLSAGKHLKNDVDKAMEVSKASYQTMSIGGHKLDPWVKADQDFNALMQSIVPKKSDAVFFPKGWNTEIGEHGALAFLEWFKKICEQASNVIIQDPYFDTVGLEFLARTSNSNTSFNVITCTQTPSNDDDDKDEVEKPTVPNRATRLINMLTDVPELFSYLKLTVYDYRNKTGNPKNLLHDRYIIVYGHDEEPKGFHLSNSIQNATQNYPLLITPIPLDVLQSVEKYSADLLDEGNRTDTFEMVQIYDYQQRINENRDKDLNVKILPPDEQLFAELKSFVKTEEETNYDAIKHIFEPHITGDGLKFEKFWDTFGHFLANIPAGDVMLYHVKDWFSPTHSQLLKQYLNKLANGENLDKFRCNRDLGRSGYHLLFIEDFDEALQASSRAENIFFEDYGFGNYAAGYASWVLLKIDVAAFEDLLKSIRVEIMERKGKKNMSGKPILRIAAILFTDLAREMFWHGDATTIKTCLLSEVMPLRTLAIDAVAADAVAKKDQMTFEEVKQFFCLLSFDEEVKAYVALLHKTRFDRGIPQDQLRTDCFKKLLQLLKCKDTDVIFAAVERIVADRYFELIEAHTTNNLFMPLLDAGSITIHDVQNFWRLKFEKELQECNTISKNTGVLDLAGWSIYIADDVDGMDFVNSLAKISKRYFATIRKPFMSGTTAWENDYNRLLMIQTATMIALNYLKSREENPEELSEKLNSLFDEIKTIKINYPYFRDYNESHLFNKQIAEKDFS